MEPLASVSVEPLCHVAEAPLSHAADPGAPPGDALNERGPRMSTATSLPKMTEPLTGASSVRPALTSASPESPNASENSKPPPLAPLHAIMSVGACDEPSAAFTVFSSDSEAWFAASEGNGSLRP